ncbi:sodium-dependent proline transporter [Stomoxys calcitrans]|uniref:sodium-dependent proline transporter n=1 Tax=Stomoxys calcitrans TaxID=35570 RepID=UPI0027E21C05|nr:sodium-dependent proline transporter [Stomoxys calcitrans]
MNNESSYGTGHRPFVSDLKRGYWTKASDFIYAGVSFGFRMDVFALSWIATVESGVSGFLPVYLISLAFYVIPLLVVKSFMGQFSSSGFISAMRLCPLFKGIGYITLFLNICVVIYYSVFAMTPMLYLFASFKPILPWSCEGARAWTQEEVLLCPTADDEKCEGVCYRSVASVLYFQNLFKRYEVFGYTFHISWQLALSAVGVWIIIALIILMLSSIEKIGQLIRYTVQCIIALMVFFIVRFSFLPGTAAHYERIFSPNWKDFVTELTKLPAYGICAFGPGWGLFITLASFNRFKGNITRPSWLIGIGQMFIIFGLDMLEKFIMLHLDSLSEDYFSRQRSQFGTFVLIGGSSMAALKWPNLWCILFYTMVLASSITIMVLQLVSIMSSIFDEFTLLRHHKLRYSTYLVGSMALGSLSFSSLSVYESTVNLILETTINQSLINLLLIIMVTWVYGRQRFQRDMFFMTNERYATWKIYILRFFAPLCILAVLITAMFIIFLNYVFSSSQSLTMFDVFIKALPWWSIPAYMFFSLYKSQGSLKERLLKCCRPTDWYPVEAEDKLRYEEIVSSSNMTHPLTELRWDDDAFDEEET